MSIRCIQRSRAAWVTANGKWRARKRGMAALFDILWRPAEAIDQIIAQALLGAGQIIFGIHGAENLVARDLLVKGRDQAGEAFFADCGKHFRFIHSKRC